MLWGIQKYPLPIHFHRWVQLHRKLFATRLVADCLTMWQHINDEATARHFISDVFADLTLLEQKVRNFERMMQRLLQQKYLTFPPGYSMETSLNNFLRRPKWMHHPTAAPPGVWI